MGEKREKRRDEKRRDEKRRDGKRREAKRGVKRNDRRSEECVKPGGQERKTMEGVNMERKRGARQRDAGTATGRGKRGKGISHSGFQFSLA